MATDTFTHFVFVDFENVPTVDLGLAERKPVHVTILIGKNQKKLDLALVQQIHRLAAQVELVEVGASGRNALDLTLACYLGQAVLRNPTAHFHIVSRDKDFEPLIGHLTDKGVKATRCDAFAALSFLSPTGKRTAAPFSPPARTIAPDKRSAASKKPPEDRRAKLIARLKDPANRNRPSTRPRLLAHLKTALGKVATDAAVEGIIGELTEIRVLAIDAGDNVRWNP